MRKTSSLHCLDPFLDRDGVLRVGGRIKRGSFMEEIKFPVIIPRKGHVTDLIIKVFPREGPRSGSRHVIKRDQIQRILGDLWNLCCSVRDFEMCHLPKTKRCSPRAEDV